MKKFSALLFVLVMCLSLVACGGPDKQPAIDSYNKLADTYNEFVEYVNDDLDSYTQEDIDFLNDCVTVIEEYGAKLDSDAELTQEEIDEMVEMFDEFNGVIEELLAEYKK